MPVGWFDEVENNPGSLAVKLQSEAQLVNNLTSSIVGIQVSNTSALLTGMIIAFYFNWRITLVSLGLAPLMMVAGQIQAQFMQGFSEQSDDANKDSGNLV
jgi:ATP-binding cassette, subfamily B (MDR/TAP), member 1